MFSEHAYALKFELKEKFSMLPQPLISRSRNAFQEYSLVKILDDELLLFLVYKGLFTWRELTSLTALTHSVGGMNFTPLSYPFSSLPYQADLL